MLRFYLGSVVGIFTFVSPVLGASLDNVVTASDSTRVKVEANAETGTRKFMAPVIRFTARGRTDGYAIVSRTVEGGVMGQIEVSGLVRYPDKLRKYDHAKFSDGQLARFRAVRDDKVCEGEDCIFTEQFKLSITPEQLAFYADSYDKVPLLVASTHSEQSFIVYVPVNHFAAVLEVSSHSLTV
ncbi:hypothetical protein K7H13_13660 [Qipengyuania citrea]|uniref:hypothetical protein n=1 Tax=Qipengyuania citrea TaxID=225971 RepID=UPI001E3F4026|nr:hypothetical protein [Qipengyuania citrea]MCD1591795.1 hypothetical protein [Qipengyuania citrea]